MTGGYLTQEMISAALDEMWYRRIPLAPAGYAVLPKSRYRDMMRELVVKDPDWTVQAGGWKLVIEGGAIRGLEST